jgi:pyruvate dehydrogenase E1 component alpha subunit
MAPHATSDEPRRYREDSERLAWEAKDPLLRLRTHLERYGHADAGYFEELAREAEQLALRVREGVRAMPDPDPAAMFRHVYVEEHAQVSEERRKYEAFQATFAEAAESTEAAKPADPAVSTEPAKSMKEDAK